VAHTQAKIGNTTRSASPSISDSLSLTHLFHATKSLPHGSSMTLIQSGPASPVLLASTTQLLRIHSAHYQWTTPILRSPQIKPLSYAKTSPFQTLSITSSKSTYRSTCRQEYSNSATMIMPAKQSRRQSPSSKTSICTIWSTPWRYCQTLRMLMS
jgi:hypothetical protein